MKKKYILLILLCSSLLVFTGCTNKKEEKKEVNKTIEYLDDKTGYKTVFTFNSNEDYEVTDTETDGKYKEITIQSKKLNIELEIYYSDHYTGGYAKQKENREGSDGYKEYTWGDYKGYIYNVDEDDLDFNIFLENFDERDIVLFGTIDDIDSTLKTNVLEAFNSDSFQNFLKSIKFSH